MYMKLVIQRVAHASVEVAGACVGRINQGLVLLLGIEQGDRLEQVSQLASKVLKLRLWPDRKDPSKQWSSSVVDNRYGLLIVSQFTLFATFKKPKPDFHRAMGGDEAQALYEAFVEQCRKGIADPELVATGKFGAMMDVDLRNDGPVTVELVAEPSRGNDGSSHEKAAAATLTDGRPQGKSLAKAAEGGGCGNTKAAAGEPSGNPRAEALGTTLVSHSGDGGNVPSELGPREDAILAQQSYLGGFTPTRIDADLFQRLGCSVPSGLPHVARWAAHVGSFTTVERMGWP